ncbi:MAG: SoxR reducing system RseC family protein [Planctomycetia bacterium]|nr:SoxR reducing system RseC family protein [Planctomycetia bacterium]
MLNVEENGTILRIEGGQAHLQLRRKPVEACKTCCACSFTEGKEFVLLVPVAPWMKVDQAVIIDIPTGSAWRPAVTVFGLPLVGFIVGISLGSKWAWLHEFLGLSAETAGVTLGALFGLVLFIVATIAERRLGKAVRVTPAPGATSQQEQ